MRAIAKLLALGLLAAPLSAGSARSTMGSDALRGPAPPSADYLQCVPFARDTSGIRLYGDAHTWWNQAQGKYARGRVPKVGAVMAIRPYGNSTLGHVATVSRVVDDRTILISHANWSNRGQIERDVTAIDVSPRNDWSQVRVWFAPIRNLGQTHWPVAGFIYNGRTEPADASPRARTASDSLAIVTPSEAAKAERKAIRTNRKNDPIGAIIAGAY